MNNLIQYITRSAWAILPETLCLITSIIEGRANGQNPVPAKSDINPSAGYGYEVKGGRAIIKIYGVMGKRFNLLDHVSGGVSTEMVLRDFLNAVEDKEVKSIVLDVDSPGGTVDGTKRLADAIYNSRGKKPIIAYANGTMASAAYYVGSAADKVFAHEDSYVGSIGTLMVHQDRTESDKKNGIKFTVIRSGKNKALGLSVEKLSERASELMQGEINYLSSIFFSDVARYRGLGEDVVKERFGAGGVFIGQQAVDNGLVDELSSIDGLLEGPSIQSYSDHAKSEQINKQKERSMKIDVGDGVDVSAALIKKEFPEVYQEIFERGRSESSEAQAQAERSRVCSILERAGDSQMELGVKLVVGGESLESATDALLKDAQKSKYAAANDFFDSAPDPIPQGEFDADVPSKEELQVEMSDRLRSEANSRWRSDKKLRQEFNENKVLFLHYVKGKQSVKEVL